MTHDSVPAGSPVPPGPGAPIESERGRPSSRRLSVTRLPKLLRPLPLLLVLGWAAHRSRTSTLTSEAQADRSVALAAALEDLELETKPDQIFWIDPPPGALPSRWKRPRAVTRSHRPGEPADVYLVETQLTPEGRLLDVTATFNLTDTSAADERNLTVADDRLAWTIGSTEETYLVQYLDLRGAPPPDDGKWTRVKRWQRRLTNLQKTGNLDGVARRTFKLDPAAARIALHFTDEALRVESDDRRIRVPTEADGPIEGRRFVREQPHHDAPPGNLVTWAVDRVRQSPLMSDDQMQFVKMVGFWGLDWMKRVAGTVTGDDGSAEVEEEFGHLLEAAPPVEYTDPETGWPPSPLEPILSRPLEGEGLWRLLGDDPFVRTNPEAPAPFAMAFLRTDKDRPYTLVYVVLWDPRQVELHTMSGTIEPKSATGETGPGLVPRDPAVMSRLVAGLNGGFQASHGEYGMMADGVVYLPPKPYAATVARLDDGSTGFGTWPEDDTVPPEILDFRQNMTPVVQDGDFNPYKRNWWGGVPPGWKDESRTVRSAICLTKEGFVAYLYGAGIDFEHLASAIRRARCDYAIHLDMNPGHTGLEFYHAAPAGELPAVGHELDRRWEATGEVRDMPGWEFLGRRMVKFMGLMNFPRYIDREARDFFYLTLRHVLPGPAIGADLAHREGDEGRWKVKGLPQHGWPYAVATTELRPSTERPETKVRVLKLDPKTVRPARRGAKDEQAVVVVRAPDVRGSHAVWLSNRRFVVAADRPDEHATKIASGWLERPSESDGEVVAALGVGDKDGMLYYAEIATAPKPGADGELLTSMLRAAGAGEVLVATSSLHPALGGDRDLSGHPVRPESGGLVLVRAEAVGAKRIFRDTPIVEPLKWYSLQSKRVRYFKKKKKAADEGSEAPAPSDDSEAGG